MKKHDRAVRILDDIVRHLTALSPLHEDRDNRPLTEAIAGAVAVALRLRQRLEYGGNAPVVAAVLGATGTGKSKLFNTLIGTRVSPSGFKRPTTMAPVLFVSSESGLVADDSFFAGYKKRKSADLVEFDPESPHDMIVVPGSASAWKGLVLVDTPDFDSVLEANRQAASDVFDRSDAVIFVTDAVKYADQASWDYLDRIRRQGKEAVLVVNRLKNPLSRDDFVRRLRDAGLQRTVLAIKDDPDLADTDLLPSSDPAVAELKRTLDRWSSTGRLELLLREAEADWKALGSQVSEQLLPALADADEEIRGLKDALADHARQMSDHIDLALSVAISSEMKESLITQIQTLFLKWDLLKYPRRIMSMPYRFIRDRVLAPLGVAEKGGARTGLDSEVERLFEANREMMVSLLHDYNRQARELFTAGPVGRGLTHRPEFETLTLTQEQVRERYAAVRAELESWVREQARELVKDLDLGEKMTFYLAQIVSLGLFISVQVHTGGGFSFFDGLIDSVVAPVLSKFTGSALSREKVKAFEIRAETLHKEGCRGIIRMQEQAYLDFLSASEDGLAAALPLSRALDDLERAVGGTA